MKVVFICGPTASGKTDLAIHLAQKYSAAIINCDSIQCYAQVNLGSAKPSAEEMRLVPHHLFDFVKSPEELTAGRYRVLALEKLKQLADSGAEVAFIVGGTGFYWQALEKGMYETGPADLQLTMQIEQQIAQGDVQVLWDELCAQDPETAARISINDHYRLARAIEVLRTYKRKPSELKKQKQAEQSQFPYPVLKIRLTAPREWLEARVSLRVDQWIERGWIDEVRALLAQDLGTWAPMRSVGFLQIQNYLTNGNYDAHSMLQLKQEIVTRTMQLAKKQRTWFQRDQEMNILPAEHPEKGLLDAEILVNGLLKIYQ